MAPKKAKTSKVAVVKTANRDTAVFDIEDAWSLQPTAEALEERAQCDYGMRDGRIQNIENNNTTEENTMTMTEHPENQSEFSKTKNPILKEKQSWKQTILP